MQAGKKNMERIAEVVPDSDEQVLLHFLSISKLGRARCPRAIPLPTSLAADAPDRRKCLICCCWRPWKQFKMCPITP
jgi:hypothetical protein